jgi:monofunctional biosynthetic peptidoglycan transglycosylase
MRTSVRDYGDARRRPQARPRRVWLRRLLQATLVAAALPVLSVLVLRWVDPPTSAFMLAYRIEQGAWPRFQWQPIEAISPQLAIAVVAAEDQRFPQHAGFDVDAIRSALDEAREGGRRRGASTLSQQVAKNLFLWETSSWPRKGLEAGLTVLIEALWPKRRILEMHLNLAEFGPGVYGAEAAAQHWFGRSAAALAVGDAARLAVVLPAPRHYSPVRPSPVLQRRAAWVQQQVRQLGGPAYLRDCCGLQ